MKKPNLLKTVCLVFVFCAATAIASPAQVLTTLYSFCSQANCTDGSSPYAGLVQATDGNFYGTTYLGGNGVGTVFKITPTGTLTTLYSFCPSGNCTDGAQPNGALIQASDGNFYGTAAYGGASNDGTVFEIAPNGSETTLYSFCSQSKCADGAHPAAGLVQGSDGNFYGTTIGGGASNNPNCTESPEDGCGTVFQITPQGALTTLHSFISSDGANPTAALVQGADGNFYGTTTGLSGQATVFKITPSGTLTTLHIFSAEPYAGLVQASDGNFYGTTVDGGTNEYGTVFKITPNGTLTTLYSFCSQTNCADGSEPYAGLMQATDGNFYGTTSAGGASGNCSGGCGTAFKITPTGTLTTLYSFSGPDGKAPHAGLVQASDRNFYGTTSAGGTNGDGTVFRLVLPRACIFCSAERS